MLMSLRIPNLWYVLYICIYRLYIHKIIDFVCKNIYSIIYVLINLVMLYIIYYNIGYMYYVKLYYISMV